MNPQLIIRAMKLIAEAAASEASNNNSTYSGMEMRQAEEKALKLLTDPNCSNSMDGEHDFAYSFIHDTDTCIYCDAKRTELKA